MGDNQESEVVELENNSHYFGNVAPYLLAAVYTAAYAFGMKELAENYPKVFAFGIPAISAGAVVGLFISRSCVSKLLSLVEN